MYILILFCLLIEYSLILDISSNYMYTVHSHWVTNAITDIDVVNLIDHTQWSLKDSILLVC